MTQLSAPLCQCHVTVPAQPDMVTIANLPIFYLALLLILPLFAITDKVKVSWILGLYVHSYLQPKCCYNNFLQQI